MSLKIGVNSRAGVVLEAGTNEVAWLTPSHRQGVTMTPASVPRSDLLGRLGDQDADTTGLAA